MSHTLYIGLTGRMASGKGEAVKILESKGFRSISLSDIVREEAKKIGGHFSREQMQDLGNLLRQEEGPGVLAKRTYYKILQSTFSHWVIDGIRNPEEIKELRKLEGFQLIGIEVPITVLLERLKRRRRFSDQISEEDLRRGLDREWGVGEPLEGQQVGACMKLCDHIIENIATLDSFANKIDQILKTMEE